MATLVQRFSVWCVGTILFVLPIFFVPALHRSFDFSKNIVFRSGVLLLAVLLIARWVLKRKIQFQKARFFSPFSLVIFAFFVILYFATLFSQVPIASLFGNYHRTQGFLQWLFYAGFYIILLFSLNTKNIFSLSFCLIGSASFVALYAVLQYFGFDPVFQNFDALFFLDRVFSTMGNPDFLGQFLAPLIPLSITFLFIRRKKLERILFAAIFVLVLIALLLSQARAPVFGLVISVILFSISLSKSGIISWKKMACGTAVVVGLAVVIMATPLRNAGPLQRFTFSAENIRSLQTRIILWKDAVQLIAERPLIGYGPDTFQIYSPKHLDPAFYYLEDNLYTFADRVHNEWLEWGISGGVLAMGVYLAFIFLLVRFYFRASFTREPTSLLTQGLFLSIFVFVFQNVFTFSETTHSVVSLFLLASLVVLLAKNGPPVSFSLSRFWSWGIFFMVIGMSSWIFTKTVVLPVQAEYHYTKSQVQSSYEGMIDELKYAASKAPYESFYWYELMMQDSSSLPRGTYMLAQIEGSTPTAMTWQATLLSGENPAVSFRLFEEVINASPRYPHVRQAYGDALYRNGEWGKAIVQYEKFLYLAPPFWKWKFDIKNRSDRDRIRYRVFFSEAPDFHPLLDRLAESYENIGEHGKASYYRKYAAGGPALKKFDF